MSSQQDQHFITLARQASTACGPDDQPAAGALLVKGDEIVSRGQLCRAETQDPLRYAEMDCIANAGRRNDQAQLTLYTTSAINWLVAGTVVQFGIGTVVTLQQEIDNEPSEYLRRNGVIVRTQS